MANFLTGIMSLTFGIIILAGVFITAVKNTSTAGWTATEKTLWGLLTLAGIMGMVYGVMNVFGLA
jgi:hypothetical protein